MSISGMKRTFLPPAALLCALLAAPTSGDETRPVEVASYTLTVRLDPETHWLEGQGEIRWTNRSAAPASELRFHLYLNGFRNSASSWLRRNSEEELEELTEHGAWGWIELERLRVAGGADLLPGLEHIAPDDGNADDASVARVPLATPVAPGETLRLDVAWTAQLPFAVARTGFKNDFHFVAQWFPKLGVLEPDGTWSCPQFFRATEFYADFGDYDVTFTVPRSFVVGATGQLAGTTEQSDGTVSYRFTQPGVHDFAWTAWPGFVERRRPFREPGLPEVEMILLLPRETAGFAERYFRALEHSLSHFGRWYGPYPYPTLTMVDTPWGADGAAGMEYPTFIATGGRVLSPLATHDPENVTMHEFGHQFFYGLVATDEFRESFLDEGLNTYATARVMRSAYPPKAWSFRVWGVPLVFESVRQETPLDTSARFFRRAVHDPIARTAWGYADLATYRAMTYSKMAMLMEQVERTLSPPVMERAMRAYTTGFRFRHPRTRDLITTLSRESGRDLTPIFDQLLNGAGLLDYAVDSVSTVRRAEPIGVFGAGGGRRLVEHAEDLPGFESEVVVRRLGEVRLPVAVELRFADGRAERVAWDGEERWVRFRVEGPRLLCAEVDPDEVLVLDANRLNNSLRTDPDRRASRRWGQAARFWIQNLLETFATFA